MGLVRTVAPTLEPVSLPEALKQLRIEDEDGADELGSIQALVQAATEYAEEYTGRQFVTATYQLSLRRFADEIRLPRPPLQSVTEIQYVDQDGQVQTLDASTYDVDTTTSPGRILRAYGYSWPSVRSQEGAITITYVAGYGAPDAVPQVVRQAIKILCEHWYGFREAVVTGFVPRSVPHSFESLLRTVRIPEVV